MGCLGGKRDVHPDGGAGIGCAADGKAAADPDGTLLHADQTEMSGFSRSFMHPASVVSNDEAGVVGSGGELNGQACRVGMSNRIAQGLLTDAQQVVFDQQGQSGREILLFEIHLDGGSQNQ